jgi:hypothetical protein
VPAQRQTNMHSLTAHLCEVRDSDGTLYPAVAVDPGVSIDWPQPIAGFAGWNWEPEYAAAAAAAGLTEAALDGDTPSTAKPRTKASAKATDAPEVTA